MSKAEAAVIAAIAALVLLLTPAAHGTQLTREHAASIYALAHSVSHYRLPDIAPEIHLTTQAVLREKACPGQTCPVRAFNVGHIIYMDETLDMSSIMDASILFHEIIHFLQWANRGEAVACEEWVDREVEAYTLQAALLERANIRINMPVFEGCL